MKKTPQKPNILIVDDKKENLFTLETLLSKLETTIIQTTTGAKALNLMLEHDFALAIVDVQMPEMNGYELVELMHGNHTTKNIPVIFISAIYNDQYHYEKGYGAGAVDFLPKPFSPDILLSKAKVFLKLYNQKQKLKQVIGELNNKNEALNNEIKYRNHVEAALRETNTTIFKYADLLESSSEMAQKVISILNLDQLTKAVVKLIQSKFNYYFVSIWLVNQPILPAALSQLQFNSLNNANLDMILRAKASQQETPLAKLGYTIPLNEAEGIIGWVCKTGQFYLANDVNNDSKYIPWESLPDTQAELALALQIGQEVIGVLDIQSNKANTFAIEDRTVLQTLANQIAVAIRNAQLYKAIKLANAELEQLNTDKDKFFSIVAHDLKGPFQPLLGLSRILTETNTITNPQKISKMSKDIYASAQTIYNLLENLLEWSQMQRGRMTYKPTKLDLQQIVKRNIRLLTKNATNKNITLQSTISKSIAIYADAHMIDTIIRNLVSNALKFTPENGAITISAKLTHNTNNQPNLQVTQADKLSIPSPPTLVEVAISDTGVGISQENINKLFKIEVHHSTLGTAQEQGTGLGLIICKEMIIKNGGTIAIESTPGQGSTFKFTIPLHPSTIDSLNQPKIEMQTSSSKLESPITDKKTLPQNIIAPPIEDLSTFLEFAISGDMRNIQKQAQHIKQLDPNYQTFANTIYRLAENYEDEKILDLIRLLMID